MTVRFDRSLAAFFDFLADRFGPEVAASAAYIRDGSGYLSAVLPIGLNEEEAEGAGTEARKVAGAYVRDYRAIVGALDPGASQLLAEAEAAGSQISQGKFVKLLDRRIVGADWLRPPTSGVSGPTRIVFSSIKGGVGRSTALSVVAAHLSRRGRRVLAIDLDLEAPGIGTMLLDETELPRFGTLDYLVENGITGIDGEFVADALGGSFLGAAGARVSVLPAIGGETLQNPADALTKIARAYLEDITPNGVLPLAEQMREMVDRFAGSGEFDVILIDAKAGLHETTATALLGLGAEVLLFGIDEPQTFLGYRLLMAHLARFAKTADATWRDRLAFVVAKSSHVDLIETAERFDALLSPLRPDSDVSEQALGQPHSQSLTAEDFELSWVEQDVPAVAPDEGAAILFVRSDPRFARFDPVHTRAILDEASYAEPFRDLLEFVDGLAFAEEGTA